jgi:hypothetical protein
MDRPSDRRSPERQPHTLQLLRRLSALALALTLLLLIAPRLLGYFGLIGPTAGDRIAEAERTMRTAASYGARPEWPPMAEARKELETAQKLAAAGDHRAARGAALRATQRASEAQARALVGEGETRRRARAVVDDLDGQVNELEDMYEAVPGDLARERRSALLKSMREARKAAAAVFLANDENRFADALAREQEARRALAETRRALEAAGAPRQPAPAPATPAASSTPPPPRSPAVPYVSEGACPFECCTYRTWTVERATDVRAERSRDSPVSFSLRKGEKVEALTGAVVVSRPGRARAPRDVDLEGLTLRAGEEVHVLHPVGEGFWLVFRDGRIASAMLVERPAPEGRGEPVLQLLVKPEFAWWVLVRPAQGRPGWTDQPENFGNKDRCG